ncbi:MAG: tetratricopeptide repeat protein [Candidatus Lokiarchaeota archaeon]|nr:tetratricopeptide repeat protein [Candidatus Lokiarchaeota archaeon]
MVATIDNFEKSKEFFKSGDILNALESFTKALDSSDPSKEINKKDFILFLENLLQYSKDNNLKNEEAMVLRTLGRTHSKLKNHVEGLKYSYQALKIQKKIGRKLDIAESLAFLAEDLEISGNFDECINSFSEAAEIFHELGKLSKENEIKNDIKRLKEISEQLVKDEYILNKFHIDDY